MEEQTLIKPIVVEQVVDVEKSKAWSALTNPEELRQWFFDRMPDFKPRQGFETEFPVQSTDREFIHQWEVMDVVPGERITVKWRFAGFNGESLVTYYLKEEDSGTRIGVEARETKAFPRDILEFKRESGVEGWKYFIKQQLPQYLEGR